MRIGINHKRNRYKLPLFVFIIIITAAYIFIRRLEPMFITQLTCHANTIVTDRVNKAIYNAFDDGYSPHEMQTSEDGGVTSLSVNMAQINKMKAHATIYVQDELNAITKDKIYIPIAAIFDLPVLSGLGIRVPVTVSPMTTVDSDYSESFEKSGINQTRYRLDMNIIVGVTYCCFSFSKTESIAIAAPVVSTIINGNVPAYYGLLSGTDADVE